MNRLIKYVLVFMILTNAAAYASDFQFFEMNSVGKKVQDGMVARADLPYKLNPPNSITIEINNAGLPVDLNHEGPLHLSATIPQYGGIVVQTLCTKWDLWHPYGGTIYQFRPNPYSSNTQWKNYVLMLDIPQLSWGATSASAWVVPISDWKASQPKRSAINPTPIVELGPGAAQGTAQSPYIADIIFPKAFLEWFRATNTGRIRVGNVVLGEFGLWWDDVNPNICHMGPFKIDLNQRLAYFIPRDGSEVPTPFKVILDESSGQMYSLEPNLWR